MQKKIAAIILAAGKSERMGSPKFMLRFDHRYSFLEKLVSEYALFGCSQVAVVVNADSKMLVDSLALNLPPDVIMVTNHHVEWGRFYSLRLAADVLNRSLPAFVSNIDNPFVCQQLLNLMYLGCAGCDYASPSYNGRGGHPFYLSAGALDRLRLQQNTDINLKTFLSRFNKLHIPVDEEKILLNINTPEDFGAANF